MQLGTVDEFKLPVPPKKCKIQFSCKVMY